MATYVKLTYRIPCHGASLNSFGVVWLVTQANPLNRRNCEQEKVLHGFWSHICRLVLTSPFLCFRFVKKLLFSFCKVALGVPVWDRYRVITGFLLVIDAIAYTSMVALFWPSRVSDYFSVKPTPLQTTMVYSTGDSTAQGSYDSL